MYLIQSLLWKTIHLMVTNMQLSLKKSQSVRECSVKSQHKLVE